MQTIALILFIITYVLMIALSEKRPYVALISAVLYVALGIMPVNKIFGAIDWNVLMMLAGTMGTVFLFIESKMPNRLADLILKKTPNVMWVAVAMSLFAGIVSAFVDNVATVLYFGLLSGATLGGNLTPIGASANITGIGILRKEGYEVKSTTFMKFGVPFTLAAVITGYILLWVIWN